MIVGFLPVLKPWGNKQDLYLLMILSRKTGVTEDLDLPWSKSVSRYGPPLADLDPLYQTFLLSILYIIFGN